MGCVNRSGLCEIHEVILLLPLALARAQRESSVQFWALPFRKDVAQLERVQKKAARMSRGRANMTYEERSKELGLFSLKERSLGLEACKSSNMWKVTGEKGADCCVCPAGGSPWHQECHQEAVGMLLWEPGTVHEGFILPAGRGGCNIDLSRFLLDLSYCLYDVIIIFNTSDLIFLATPIPFRKRIPFHGFVLCTNIPLTEDQTNLISLMPLLGFQIIP